MKQFIFCLAVCVMGVYPVAADTIHLTDGTEAIGKLKAKVIVFEVDGVEHIVPYSELRALVTNNPLIPKKTQTGRKGEQIKMEELFTGVTAQSRAYEEKMVEITRAIFAQGEAIDEELLADTMFNCPDLELRIKAAERYKTQRTENSLDNFITLLNDDEPKLQIIATKALGEFGDMRAILPLSEVLARTRSLVDRDPSDNVYLKRSGSRSSSRYRGKRSTGAPELSQQLRQNKVTQYYQSKNYLIKEIEQALAGIQPPPATPAPVYVVPPPVE